MVKLYICIGIAITGIIVLSAIVIFNGIVKKDSGYIVVGLVCLCLFIGLLVFLLNSLQDFRNI